MNVLDKVYNLTVDIKNIDTKYNSYAKFFDDDRETSVIKVKILNNNSPIDLENCSVEAYFVLANNTYHNETCKIINSSEGIVELQLCQKCLVKGENIVRLSILKDNEIANTPIITYEIRKGLYSDNPNFNDDPLTPILSQMLLDVKVTKVNQIELQERYEKSLPKIEGKIKEVESLINRVDTAIASGTQDLEVKEARANKKGIVYAKLGDRLDEVDSQLEHIKNVNVKEFGAKGDGITDDTLQIQNAIDSLGDNGGTVVFPKGEYIVTGIKLKSNVSIVGELGSQSFGYSLKYGTVVLKALSDHIFDVSGCDAIKIEGIFFNGNARNANALYAKDERCRGLNVTNCRFYECNNAISSSSSKTLNEAIIENNKIMYCNTAITGVLDSRIINNFINANIRSIYLREGNNDNIITTNKIEWNEYGIECYRSHHNIISNNIFDRQSNQGVYINNSVQATVSNNVFRRNGADTTNAKNKCHIKLESSDNIVVIGNITIANNSKDDNSGVTVPEYSLFAYGNTSVLITNNDLSGYTSSRINDFGSNNNFKVSLNIDDYTFNDNNLEFNGVILSSGCSYGKHIESKSYANSLSAEGNINVTLTKKHGINTYYRSICKLKIASRNENNGNTNYSEIPIVICREGGSATVKMYTSESDDFVGRLISITATSNENGTELYFNITNLSSNKFKLFLELV